MLVISRRVGDRVRIGPNIWVMVTRIDKGSVRIAIDAPRHLVIEREELVMRSAPKATEESK
jgi:carbon storage regulator